MVPWLVWLWVEDPVEVIQNKFGWVGLKFKSVRSFAHKGIFKNIALNAPCDHLQ